MGFFYSPEDTDKLFFVEADDSAESSYWPYLIPMAIVGMTIFTGLLLKYAETCHEVKLQSKTARVVAGVTTMYANTMLTTPGDMIEGGEGELAAIVKHYTAWEAFVYGIKHVGNPPRFPTTTMFNGYPGAKEFLALFNVIMVEANAQDPTKNGDNFQVLVEACNAIERDENVTFFPTGNWDKIGQKPHPVFDGTGIVALVKNKAIKLYRIEGVTALEYTFIPIAWRNSIAFRAFLSALLPNNVKFIFCSEIDVHLKEANQALPPLEKLRHINAELYAFARHEKLTPETIGLVKADIESGRHLPVWDNKAETEQLIRYQKRLDSAHEEKGDEVVQMRQSQYVTFEEKHLAPANTPSENVVSTEPEQMSAITLNAFRRKNMFVKNTETLRAEIQSRIDVLIEEAPALEGVVYK
ncbi:MAG: hypothetical protein P1U32_05195 [Legionellaceae bacterium]|nr:hypothetical protein [Legionellaceae bacterium]